MQQHSALHVGQRARHESLGRCWRERCLCLRGLGLAAFLALLLGKRKQMRRKRTVSAYGREQQHNRTVHDTDNGEGKIIMGDKTEAHYKEAGSPCLAQAARVRVTAIVAAKASASPPDRPAEATQKNRKEHQER